jgi:hypothetical protein
MKMTQAVESGSLTNPRINSKNFGQRLEEYVLIFSNVSIVGIALPFSSHEIRQRANKHHRPPLANELFESRPLFAETIQFFHAGEPSFLG